MSNSNKKSNGMNRQQRRNQERNPQQQSKSSKPLGLRILIIAVFVVMLLGFVVLPLLK